MASTNYCSCVCPEKHEGTTFTVDHCSDCGSDCKSKYPDCGGNGVSYYCSQVQEDDYSTEPWKAKMRREDQARSTANLVRVHNEYESASLRSDVENTCCCLCGNREQCDKIGSCDNCSSHCKNDVYPNCSSKVYSGCA